MRTIFSVIMFLILSCSQPNFASLSKDKVILDAFTTEQISDLEYFIDKVDSIVIARTKTSILKDSYRQYCKFLINAESIEGLEMLLDRDREFYNSLIEEFKNFKVFSDIWIAYSLSYPKQNSAYEYLGVNINGNYIVFLEAFTKFNCEASGYFDAIISSGEIRASIALGLLVHNERYDFSNPATRLLFAIHFATIHYKKSINLP